jgi:hypothetical protein
VRREIPSGTANTHVLCKFGYLHNLKVNPSTLKIYIEKSTSKVLFSWCLVEKIVISPPEFVFTELPIFLLMTCKQLPSCGVFDFLNYVSQIFLVPIFMT